MVASVTMKGWSLNRAIMKPLNDADREPHGERDGDRRGEGHVGLQADGEQPRKGHHRPDRQVDAACQNDQQHAEAQEAVGDELARDADHVALGQEDVGGNARDDHER